MHKLLPLLLLTLCGCSSLIGKTDASVEARLEQINSILSDRLEQVDHTSAERAKDLSALVESTRAEAREESRLWRESMEKQSDLWRKSAETQSELWRGELRASREMAQQESQKWMVTIADQSEKTRVFLADQRQKSVEDLGDLADRVPSIVAKSAGEVVKASGLPTKTDESGNTVLDLTVWGTAGVALINLLRNYLNKRNGNKRWAEHQIEEIARRAVTKAEPEA